MFTGVKVDIPVLTDRDIADLQQFACKHRVDYVAASFVQSAQDVHFIRSVLDEAGGADIKIVSKIENQAGVDNLDEIIQATDGVMIARGDLGMELPPCKLPLAQQVITAKCLQAGKFVICATQVRTNVHRPKEERSHNPCQQQFRPTQDGPTLNRTA
jgi:pyruvate kinase